jgi:hypothetical protein
MLTFAIQKVTETGEDLAAIPEFLAPINGNVIILRIIQRQFEPEYIAPHGKAAASIVPAQIVLLNRYITTNYEITFYGAYFSCFANFFKEALQIHNMTIVFDKK